MGKRTSSTPQEFYTAQELSHLLKIPEQTLSDWRKKKAGPNYYKVGRHVRYADTDVAAWLAEGHREVA